MKNFYPAVRVSERRVLRTLHIGLGNVLLLQMLPNYITDLNATVAAAAAAVTMLSAAIFGLTYDM
jgi:hypothetical protein